MRTTVTLDDDVAAAVTRLRRERGVGVSEALNELVRDGLAVKPPRQPYRHRTARLALTLDVTNVAEALEQLDGPTAR
jgi:metal-responsive CopG/Arc/MetJ family transcriptional regulator